MNPWIVGAISVAAVAAVGAAVGIGISMSKKSSAR
jgi:hypothetical protein